MEEEDLKTYVFSHKNSSAVITISSECFDNAEMDLHDLHLDTRDWRCDNKKGETEDVNIFKTFEEEHAEIRMNIIGQNGNEGSHYKKE